MKSSSSETFRQNKVVNVKLSGDGLVSDYMWWYSSLQYWTKIAGSAAENHILAVFKQSESYDCLKLALDDIMKEVDDLQVEDITFKIKYYLGGDWKFLAVVTGIDSASSDHACIWCKCKKDDRGDIQRVWSLSDKEQGARTIDENTELAQRPRSRKAYNVSHEPLFHP